MSAVRKFQSPANDTRNSESVPCAYAPRMKLNVRYKITAGALAFFALALSALLFAHRLPSAPKQMAMQAAPYDIRLNAPEAVAAAEETPPVDSTPAPAQENPPHDDLRQHVLQPVLQITVDADKAPASMAASDDASAREAAERGDLKQALALQASAVAASPGDMAYRLDYAILSDRNGDKATAAALYRQVIDAYGNSDATLPQNIAIDSIRARYAYLLRGSR